jgi:hypothetical protein
MTIESHQSEAELKQNLKAWLRDTIAKLEQQRANGKV